MPDKTSLSRSYQQFSSAEGNQHIASEYAIKKILELVGKFNIGNILEVGLGIGSIAGTLLELNKKILYTGTEANNFCLEALPQNLGSKYDRLKIFDCLKALPRNIKFNLVIIDGKDTGLRMLKDLIADKGIIAIEGDRMPQQELLQELFPNHKYVHSISKKKNKRYSPFSPDNWQGGIKIIFINPNLRQKIWWIREKILTRLKYIIRNSR